MEGRTGAPTLSISWTTKIRHTMRTITRASTAPHASRGKQRRSVTRVRAQKEDGEEEVPLVELRRRAESSRTKKDDAKNVEEISVNPIDLGRKTREIVDDVWQKFSELGQIMSSSGQRVAASGEFDIDEFEVDPLAKRTTVLVVGATSRVGRVLLRKLVLRGFRVKAFVRDPKDVEGVDGGKHDGEEVQDRLATIPPSVEVVFGDVGDPKAVADAMEGVDKIICCLRSRSTVTADLRRVDQEGVANLAKSLIDLNHAKAKKRAGKSAKSKLTLTKFSKQGEIDKWKAVDLASMASSEPSTNDILSVVSAKYRAKGMQDAQAGPGNVTGTFTSSRANLEMQAEEGNALFSGAVYARRGMAAVGRPLEMPPGFGLDRYEGVVLRICGDGKSYSFWLRVASSGEGTSSSNGEGQSTSDQFYAARFFARPGWSTVRIPFTQFRPLESGYVGSTSMPQLNLRDVKEYGVAYELTMRKPQTARTPGGGPPEGNSFNLLISFIKALPSGSTPDFVLVSCSGQDKIFENDYSLKEKVMGFKRAGESALRNSGLGYTIIRPGALIDEPGGQKALIFDQGERITQGISYADVADLCVEALFDPTAFNKSFDVCYEYTSNEAAYELVARVQSTNRSLNYLAPALQTLEKNT